MVEATLQAIRMGGIYDHMGIGCHRYSTDANGMSPISRRCSMIRRSWPWPTPKATRPPARGVRRHGARDPGLCAAGHDCARGGFFSAEDADSEGVRAGSMFGRLRRSTGPWITRSTRSSSGYSMWMRAETSGKGAEASSAGLNLVPCRTLLKITEPDLYERLELIRAKLFHAGKERPSSKGRQDSHRLEWIDDCGPGESRTGSA